MTTDRLRDELARIAAEAPVAAVDTATWGRARRARTRDRVVGVLGAVAAVALVAGLATTGLPRQDDAPVTSADGLGVPDRLYAVPERMAERDGVDWARSEVGDDLAIGRGAAAWLVDGALPVVVDAEDGTYHLLDLPGFAGNDAQTATFTGLLGLDLSPDGRRLAYAWGDPVPEDAGRPVASGVRVLDLETGDVRSIPVEGGEGTLVSRLRFSPDGQWLVWVGRQLAAWTEGSIGGGSPAAGRIAPDVDASTPITGFRPALSDASGDLGVADSGLVVAVSQLAAGGTPVVQRWDGGFLGRARITRTDGTPLGTTLQAGTNVSPDGRLVAVGSCCTRSAYVADVTTGEVVTTAPLDDRGSLSGADPVGWLDVDTSVWEVVPQDGGDGALVLVDADGSARDVGELEDGPSPRSLATDLMSTERPTTERAEPDWPWSTTRHLAVWGSLAVVVLLVLVGVGSRRRVWAVPRLALAPPPFGTTGPEGLWVGGLGAAALSVGWLFLAVRLAEDRSWEDLLIVSVPGAVMVTGAALLFFRGWRWWAAGLLLGPPAAGLATLVWVFSQLSGEIS